MPNLTDQGRQVLNDLVQRHGFSPQATEEMLVAVINGNGQQAQFSHPEFGGYGQWMRGGMIMIGDMFNNYLKGRVDSLCCDISSILQSQGGLMQTGSFQSQSQGGSNSQRQESGSPRAQSSLFMPDPSLNWWPVELGSPNATGSQNQMQYAYFANSRRLAVKTGNSVWVYDTQDHQIGGFSQQQSGSGSITFTSQFGTVNLSSLPVVMRDGQSTPAPTTQPAVATPSWSPDTPSAPTSAANVGSQQPDNIFSAIEKLGELRSKGLLTDEEFHSKKQELLSRL